jgi:hypothetical protein
MRDDAELLDQAVEHAVKVRAHCTGIEAVFAIRRMAGLDRKRCVVRSIGASFTLGKGLDPKGLAKCGEDRCRTGMLQPV